MLKTGSLKRSMKTNKIWKDKLMATLKKKRQNNIRNEKWGLSRDVQRLDS